MKIKIILLALTFTALMGGCQISEFEDNYRDPSKVTETSIEKQFTGFLHANRGYVLPGYWNYFVVLRITHNRYLQATGWVNEENQYVPGSAAIQDRWNNYYNFLAQYRELEKVYNESSDQEKEDYRLYMLIAKAYFYDHTQKIVDLHGAIPWTEAGMLSTNGGDYEDTYPAYDDADVIYTTMLDDLQDIADELRDITVKPAILTGFNTQDLINRGDLDLWVKYVNSLRLRLLTRVRDTPAFADRATSEIASILSNPGNYPLVTSNEDNILFRIHTLGTLMDAAEFQNAMEGEDWPANIAGKAILDHMVENEDPRLTYIFEPGEEADNTYLGLDPLLNSSVQTELVGSGTLTIYNRSTLTRNQYFPGVLFNASQVHLMAAEHYLEQGQDALAKEHYETAIRESVAYYMELRSMSNDNTAPAPAEVTEEDVESYINSPGISWDNAGNQTEKIKLIAEQKWLHFNLVQPNESWAEYRRLDALDLEFWVDQSNQQSQPPNRWIYPGSEQTYNTENYAKVQPMDNLNTRIFWDVD